MNLLNLTVQNINMLPILVTLFIGILNLIILIRISKKERHTDVASRRRKERIDNFIVHYSKLSALVHPCTIKAYALKNDDSFFEKLIESFSNLNMLFDQRFPIDKNLVCSIKSLVEQAITCYSVCNTSEELLIEYEARYSSKIKETDKFLNVYIGTEWSRLKKEVLTGKPINNEKEWKEMYEESKRYFEKNEQCGNFSLYSS